MNINYKKIKSIFVSSNMYLSLTLSADVTFEVDFVKVEFLENKKLVMSLAKN